MATIGTGLVAILDAESFEQVFVAANPMRVTVLEEKKITKFQVEDGSTRSDHVVQQAREISIDLMIEDDQARNMYLQIQQAWRDNKLLIVQTKVASYESMLIETMPHDVTPELGNGIAMPIKLTEWRTVTPQYGSLPPSKVANKKQSDTAKQGQKQGQPASQAQTRKASVLYGVFN